MIIVFPIGTKQPASATLYVAGSIFSLPTLGPNTATTITGPTIVRYAQLGQGGACKAQLG